MIRWICGVKLEQRLKMADLRWRLKLLSMDEVLRWNRLRLFGHRLRQDDCFWTKKIMNYDIGGPAPRGRPRLRWMDVIKMDMKKHGLTERMAADRNEWRSTIKPQLMQPDGLQPTASGQRSGNVQ